MNTQEMLRIIDAIARDRNVEREVLLRDLELAMVSAARKHFNTLDTEEFRCEVDRMTGEIRLFRHGEAMQMPPEAFGRIAAQTFKQVMIQKFREDERTSLYEEFSKRVGEITTGVAQRYEGGALVVQIDRAEGFMPRSEQIPGEQFQAGDRIRCLVLDVRDVGNQVKIVLSRSHPDFIKRLFEVEVPEVSERVIEIKAMAREAGHRTKVAVSSIDSKVDAVGACVGVRGSRIKNIVDELNGEKIDIVRWNESSQVLIQNALNGEKIDIVRWNESSQVLIQNALKPAEVAEISLCFELGRATVVVNEDQLSLAIGKRGQNVRLAARLTGWDVDILTPTEFNKGLEIMADTLQGVEGVTEEMLDRLAALGFVSVFDVEEAGPGVLTADLGVSEEMADIMIRAAGERARLVAEQQAKEKAEAETRRMEEEAAGRRLLDGGILSPGRETPTDPDALAGIVDAGAADARAAAILSGAEPVSMPAKREEPKREEPDPGYDPDEVAEFPAESDGDDTKGTEVVEGAIDEVLRKGKHETETA